MTTRPAVAQRVFSSLLEGILCGRYAAGEKLPPQRALSAEAGVTMGSVREALKRLEQMNLIEVRHGDGMRVRDWRDHGGLDVIAHGLLLSGGLEAGVLTDVLEARGLMLAELAGLAAARRSPQQAERLASLAETLAAAPDDAAARELDFVFFAELAEAAGNLVFVLILNSIRGLYFEHAARLPVTARVEELSPLYAAAAAAVRGGDAEGARRAVRRLADAQRARVQEALS